MPYRTLGRTGLRVSVMGLGASSNFGSMTGQSVNEAARVVHTAFDLGINVIDTAAIYGESEAILGHVLNDVRRDSFVLTSKYFPVDDSGAPISPQMVRDSVERSLRRLKLDAIDIMQLHGVRPNHYKAIVDLHMPILQKLQEEGKFRFLGITETIKEDPAHMMLPKALEDDFFDTAMVEYSLLNPVAEKKVLPECRKRNVGVLCMVAVRRALSQPDFLQEIIRQAKTEGRIAADALTDKGPLDWLIGTDTPSIPAAGYRYVRTHPAISTVLSGTCNPDHLKDNVKAILGPELPQEIMGRLRSIFMPKTDDDCWSAFDL